MIAPGGCPVICSANVGKPPDGGSPPIDGIEAGVAGGAGGAGAGAPSAGPKMSSCALGAPLPMGVSLVCGDAGAPGRLPAGAAWADGPRRLAGEPEPEPESENPGAVGLKSPDPGGGGTMPGSSRGAPGPGPLSATAPEVLVAPCSAPQLGQTADPDRSSPRHFGHSEATPNLLPALSRCRGTRPPRSLQYDKTATRFGVPWTFRDFAWRLGRGDRPCVFTLTFLIHSCVQRPVSKQPISHRPADMPGRHR